MFKIKENMFFLTKITEWFYSFSKKEKNIIIDPISCLIKLSILSLYPPGTKVSVSNNGITFCDSSIFQGSIRFLQGDCREDLHNIFKPIQKSIEWFWNNDKYGKELEELFLMSEKGLDNLKSCYDKNTTIQHSLDHYILYLKNKDNIKYDNECKQKELKEELKELNKLNKLNQIENNDIIINEKNIIYDYLQNLWSLREIRIIIDLFIEYKEKQSKEEKENIILNINNMTNTKEKLLAEFIKEQSSTL